MSSHLVDLIRLYPVLGRPRPLAADQREEAQASFVIAITIPARTNTMIATCIQNQCRGIRPTLAAQVLVRLDRDREAHADAAGHDEDGTRRVLDRPLRVG